MITRIEILNTSRDNFDDVVMLFRFIFNKTKRSKLTLSLFTGRPSYYRLLLDLKKYTIIYSTRGVSQKKKQVIKSTQIRFKKDLADLISRLDKEF